MAIYAVDFDGTLAVTRFPEIVEPKRKIVAAVKMLKANGHKVILWTSRSRPALLVQRMTQERFMRIFT